MKGLHKKISVGVLISGLLIGGVSFRSGSISYASSKNSSSSLFLELIEISSQFNIKLSPELEAFSKGGLRGVLAYDYSKSELPKVLNNIQNRGKKDVYKSIAGLSEYGGYAVLGFELEGKKYFINNYNEYWGSPPKNFNFNDFRKLARDRFDKGKDNFKNRGLEVGSIYKVKIDNKYDFLIFVFDENGNV